MSDARGVRIIRVSVGFMVLAAGGYYDFVWLPAHWSQATSSFFSNRSTQTLVIMPIVVAICVMMLLVAITVRGVLSLIQWWKGSRGTRE